MRLIKTLQGRGKALYDLLAARPAHFFWLFVSVQVLLWTLIPALVFRNLPLDVIELLSWGHEWQLGYAKHPPLPAWILEAVAVLSGRMDGAAWLISQLSIALCYWAIWRLGRETLTGDNNRGGQFPALLAVLLTSLIFYYNLPTIEFNHNILAIPVWALMGLYGWLALRDDRLQHWLLLGLLAGLSIYIKYSQAIMVLCLLAFLVIFREGRARLKSPGLWSGVVLALLAALPHLWWMFGTDFQSLFYATGRTRPLVGFTAHIIGPLKFLAAQIGAQGGMLLVILLGGAVLPYDRRRGQQPVSFAANTPLARRYLLWVALVPVLFVTFLSLVLGMKFRSMWGAPMFSFSALALMAVMKPFLFRERFGFMAACWLILQSGVVATVVGMGTIGSFYSKKPLRTDYPGRDIGQYFSQLWRQKTGLPLRYVDGDEWIGDNISWYAPERPSHIARGNPQARPWMDQKDIACKGVLIVWKYSRDVLVQMPEDYGPVRSLYSETGQKQFNWKLKDQPVQIGWAIIAPDKACRQGLRER